jgi:hypothetical protein
MDQSLGSPAVDQHEKQSKCQAADFGKDRESFDLGLILLHAHLPRWPFHDRFHKQDSAPHEQSRPQTTLAQQMMISGRLLISQHRMTSVPLPRTR